MDKQQAFDIIVNVTGQVQADRAAHEKIRHALTVIQQELFPVPEKES